jgi:DNA repair protein RecN (Recombination protein N)
MLRSLSIRDFVIVDRLDLEFVPGFTVLTGETGAGKSILIDALATVLGERAETGLVRDGKEKAEVSAEFAAGKGSPVAAYLTLNDLAGDGDACLLRRVVEATGRSRAYVNGRPATVQQLREIGEFLVDIHGQHAHQSLMRPAAQRELLDGYAGNDTLAEATAAAFHAWQEVRKRRLALETDAHALAVEKEQLDWQVRELDALGFEAGEWEDLQGEHRRLVHAASLIEAVEQALEALSEGERSALSMVDAVNAKLGGLTDYDPQLKEVTDVLEPARIQLQEAVYGLRHYQQRLELDPARLRALEERLDAVHTAARKFRLQIADIPERLSRMKERLAELQTGFDADALREREAKAEAAYRGRAQKLTSARRKAASALAEKVTQAMQELAMGGGVFDVAMHPLAEGNAHGAEQIEFLVAGHAGAVPRALAKVASGGELSRISLAIQTVTSRIAAVPTLIFDEVDAGIGGRVAEIVGRMLKDLGRKHQVMCVTHLPQVAAAGDQQWQVAKAASDGMVKSQVTALDRAGRVEEVARMLGGMKITDTTRRHAAEMLEGSAGSAGRPGAAANKEKRAKA